MFPRLLAPITALALFLPALAHAVPNGLTHQGRLFEATGAPLEGDHEVSFGLHDAPAGGDTLWSAVYTVTFDNGYYAVLLGDDAAPIDDLVLSGAPVYLELAIGGGAPLPTRLPVVSVPYAVRAQTATNVRGGVVDASEILVGGASVISGSGDISWSNITDVPLEVSTDGLDELLALCDEGDILRTESGSWACTALSDHDHDASQITGGIIDLARLPLGSDADSVAPGDHDHPAYAYDGTDFVPSGQSCSTGELQAGSDESGNLLCVTAVDTDTTNFVEWDQQCPSGQVAAGADGAGQLLCIAAYADDDVLALLASGVPKISVDDLTVNSTTVINGSSTLNGPLTLNGDSTINGTSSFAGDMTLIGNLSIVSGGLSVDGATYDDIPGGAVVAFNLTSCSTGWSAANGSGGTVDLRGRVAVGAGNWPQGGGSTAVGDKGGSHRWRIGAISHHEEFAVGSNEHPAEGVGFGWEGEASVTVLQPEANANTIRWSAYQHHMPPHGTLLYCEKT